MICPCCSEEMLFDNIDYLCICSNYPIMFKVLYNPETGYQYYIYHGGGRVAPTQYNLKQFKAYFAMKAFW
jgi:hypothetical protein